MFDNLWIVRYRNDYDISSESVCLVDEYDNAAAVMKVGYNEDVITIDYFAVAGQYRRIGLGTYLLQTYLDCISQANEFLPVEAYYLRNEKSEELDSFFEAQGNFTVSKERSIYRISPKLRRKNNKWKKFSDAPGVVKEIFGRNNSIPDKLRAELEQNGFEGYMDEDETYSRKLSLASIGSDGKIKAAILGRAHSPKEVELAFLYKANGEVKGLFDVISAWCNVVDELYPNAEIWFNAASPNAAAMADNFFGSDTRTGGCNIARWNGVGVGEMAGFNSFIKNLKIKI